MFLPHTLSHHYPYEKLLLTKPRVAVHTHSPPSSVFPMSQILAKVYTDVITVYSGKSFPGVVCKYYLGEKTIGYERKGKEEHVKIGAVLYMLLLHEIKTDGSLVHGLARTPLSVCFLKQGVKIPVRKEDQQPGSSVASGSSGSRKRPIDQDLSIQDEDSIDSG